MSWDTILEHDEVLAAFRRAAARGRLASTFLFVGPPSIGKRTFAMKLTQALLCERNPESQLEPCGDCWSCLHLAAGTHPDLSVVAIQPGENQLLLEQFIGDREHRNQEGLCKDISLKPVRGARKIAIIDDADSMTNAAVANVLLKTLEEPPPRCIIFLIGTSALRQLPTIRSRSQIVRFGPLSAESIERLLIEKQLVEDRAEAHELAQICDGSLERALELADPELREFRRSFFSALGEMPLEAVPLAKAVLAFADAAGKDAPPRRLRLKQLAGWAADFYRQAMWTGAGGAPQGDVATLPAIDAETAADCLEICLDLVPQIDANANLQNVIDAWMQRLYRRLAAA